MEFTVDAMIHGYHEYSQIWEAEDGKYFNTKERQVTGMIYMLL